MCGIAGVLQDSRVDERRTVIERMLAVMTQRGPDGAGRWENERLTLGHRRLSILDRSENGAQPMLSASGRYIVTFNGEILNYRELCETWGIDRGALRSTSDTEVLLLMWERLGPAALQEFVGPFAFGIYDTIERRLWLVRDRVGERPLFYHRSPDALVFASTLEAVLQAPWISRELDEQVLEEYVSLRYVVSPRTVVRGVQKVPPGHMLIVDERGVRTERWWQPSFGGARAARSAHARAERMEEFDQLLARAVQRCTISDVPVGLLLSDGIDSNTIAYMLKRIGHPTAQFTFVSAQGENPEPEVTADGLTTTIAASRRVRADALHEALSNFTEPVGDGASLATWLLLRQARQAATVLLCGHGGDEVCGGYRLSQDRFRLATLSRTARIGLRVATPVYERYTYGAESVDARRRTLGACDVAHAPSAARFIIHKPLSVAEVVAMCGDPAAADRYLGAIERLYAASSDDEDDLERMQSVLLRGFLTEDILSFNDSIAMTHSVEGRTPFLDRDLMEFSLSLPSRERVGRWPGYLNTKLILRRWSKGRLDDAIVQRRKRTFRYGGLRELLQRDRDAVLEPLRKSAGVHRALPGLMHWLDQPPESFRGARDGTLWALLTLGAWSTRVGAS